MIKEKFESFLEANLPKVQSFHPFFNEALAYMLKAGGKHFRAQIFLSVVQNLKPKKLDNALMVALAIECIHTYSLIHDDLPAMDNADLRRGKKSLHKAFDETSAILVGDALNTEAFLLLSSSNLKAEIQIELIKELAFNAGLNGMVLGQALDCYFEKKKLDLNELKFLHLHKTAKLIAASLKMGAIVSESEQSLKEKLYEFGLNLGLLFQINDDLLDSIATSDELGKPTHNDTDKNSFVNLLGVDDTKDTKENLIKECKKMLINFPTNLASSLDLLMQKYLN